MKKIKKILVMQILFLGIVMFNINSVFASTLIFIKGTDYRFYDLPILSKKIETILGKGNNDATWQILKTNKSNQLRFIIVIHNPSIDTSINRNAVRNAVQAHGTLAKKLEWYKKIKKREQRIIGRNILKSKWDDEAREDAYMGAVGSGTATFKQFRSDRETIKNYYSGTVEVGIDQGNNKAEIDNFIENGMLWPIL